MEILGCSCLVNECLKDFSKRTPDVLRVINMNIVYFIVYQKCINNLLAYWRSCKLSFIINLYIFKTLR